jgi:hypothetical protein
MLGTGDGRDGRDRLVFGPVLRCVHRHRGGGHDAGGLHGLDRQRGEGAAFVVAFDLVTHGLLGPSGAREEGVQGLDGLVGAAERRRPGELGEELAAEQPVIGQLLIAAFEGGHGPIIRGVAAQIETVEEIAPEVSGHTSV